VSPPVILVNGVSKRFNIRRDKSLKERLVNFRRSRKHAQTFWALRDISFEVTEGTTLGVIGHNGSGKSTLLKLIGGILTPTYGTVERRGRLAALLELGAGFHGDLTGRENVYLNASLLGLSRSQTDRYFSDIVEFSGIEEFIDTQVKFYSSGMYVRLAFAVAVHVDPEVLLIDEVLAVGDEPFQRRCLDRIRAFQRDGRTIVFVTHALDQVRELCDRAIMLDHGSMVIDGTAVDGIRAFREKFSDFRTPVAESSSNRGPDIQVVDVRLNQGTSVPRLTPGDRLTIDIDIIAREALDDYIVGFSLHNHADAVVYGVNTGLMGVALGPIEGKRTIRFQLPEVPLAEDTYSVSAAVAPSVGPIWHQLDRARSFRVLSDVSQIGVVYIATKAEVVG
jgi:ABC-2 type transport system ATP-binding protein